MPSVEDPAKRRKVETSADSAVSAPAKPKKHSGLYAPYRIIGLVCDDIPFAVGSLGDTFYIVTSVGRAFQIYDAANLHLLFVSSGDITGKITALQAHFQHVYAAWDNHIGVFRRGRLLRLLELPDPTSSVRHICVLGDFFVAAASQKLFLYKKAPQDSAVPSESQKYAAELYSTFPLDPTHGSVVSLIHPPTYLNKIAIVLEKSILIFNVKLGRVVFCFNKPENLANFSTAECSPALDIIAVGTAKGEIVIVNLRKASVLRQFSTGSAAGGSAVTSLTFRTDGLPVLAAGLASGDVFFYDLDRRRRIHLQQQMHAEALGGVARVAFLPNQPIIVSCGGDNQLKEFVFDPPLSPPDAPGGAVLAPPRYLRSRGGHAAPPTAVAFSDDEAHFLLSASRDRSFWRFSLRKDAQSAEFSQREPKLTGLAKPKGRKGGPTSSLTEKFPEITCVAFQSRREADWENVVTGHAGETFARTWRTATGRVGRWKLATTDDSVVKSVCVSECGNFGLVGSARGTIAVYNLQSGTLRKKITAFKDGSGVSGMCLDGTNRTLVAASLSGALRFFHFKRGTALGRIPLDSPVTRLAYHAGSELVAVALDNFSVLVVDVATRRVIRELWGHSNRITALAFTPDSRWLLTASLDATLRTWDIPSGGCVDVMSVPSVVTSVAVSPGGDRVATAHVGSAGVALWTNRAQFGPRTLRIVDEAEAEAEAAEVAQLPDVAGRGSEGMLAGAFDEPQDGDATAAANKGAESVAQLAEGLITLSVGPSTKFNTLVHLDTIKMRQKPKTAPAKPQKLPFFLGAAEKANGADNGAESGANNTGVAENVADKITLQGTRVDAEGIAFESEFTRKLRDGAEKGDFADFLAHLSALPPSTTDLEIKSLNMFFPFTELIDFIDAMTQAAKTRCNFDLAQAWMKMFFQAHGDVVIANKERAPELMDSLAEWAKAEESAAAQLDDLSKFCSGVLDFLSTF